MRSKINGSDRAWIFLTSGLLASVLGLGGAPKAWAEAKRGQAPIEAQVSGQQNLRQGPYRVERIEKVSGEAEPFYRIYFVELQPKGPATKIVLETYHVHVALNEGTDVKLQADLSDVTQDATGAFRAEQILVYVKREQGEVPVWMVSRFSKKLKLKGTSYLKMHDPQSDFQVF